MSTLSTINTYFTNILNRAPVGDEAANWANLVDQGVQTLDQVRASFVNSPEVQLRVAPIVQMYSAELGRTPDQPGLAFWVAQEDSGTLTLAQIAAGIAASPESQAAYGSTVDETFLNQLYQNALGRAPEDGVVASWIASGLTTTQIVAFFAVSPEANARDFAPVNAFLDNADDQGNSVLIPGGPLQPIVPPVIDNTPPPTPTFALSAPTSVADGSTVVVTLTTTNVAAGKTFDYKITGINAGDLVGGSLTGTFTVDAVGKAAVTLVLAPNTPPETLTLALLSGAASATVGVTGDQTFTLTTGVDTGPGFTGAAGNDTFNAHDDSTGGAPLPTWTTGDSINGGAGTNTFNITQTAPLTNLPETSVSHIQTANVNDGAGVTLDTTGWTGLTALHVKDIGTTDLTSAGTTATTVDDTSGNVTVTGGSTQAVSTDAGQVSLSGATGAVSVTDTAAADNTVSVDGGTTVGVTVTGVTTNGTISIGQTTPATGPVTVTATELGSETGNHTADAISVAGGSHIDITVNLTGAAGAGNTITGGGVVVDGTADTTSVSVQQTAVATARDAALNVSAVAGVADGAVTVNDKNRASTTEAGSIAAITAANFTTLAVADSALTTLNVSGGSGTISIDNGSLDTPTNKTLNLTIAGQTGGQLNDNGVYTTLNITTGGQFSTLSGIGAAGVTNLTIAGTSLLTLISTGGLAALQTVTVSGQADVQADFSGATVTSVDTTATTGSAFVTIDGGNASFTGGAGADDVTAINQVSHAISLGGGNDSLTLGSGTAPTAAISGGAGIDRLTMNASLAATSSGSDTFAGLVTGFELLTLTGATNQTIDLTALGFGANTDVTTHGGNGLTLDNFSSVGSLTLNGAGTAYTVSETGIGSPPPSGTLNLVLTDGSGAGVSFASTGISDASAATIAITTQDTQFPTPSGTFMDAVTLRGNSATTITVGGNAGLNLTARDTAATTVDASGITLGGFTWTSGALTDAATVSGSATGTNTVDLSRANGPVTYNGGSGSNDVTLGAGGGSVTVAGHDPSTVDNVSVQANTNGILVPGAVISGLNAAAEDTITFVGDDLGATSFASFDSATIDGFGTATGTGNPPTTLAAAVGDVLNSLGGNLDQHGIGAFQFLGNTYLVEQANTQGAAFNTGDTLVELTGTPDLTGVNVATGILHLAAPV